MYKLTYVDETVVNDLCYLTEKFHFNKMPKPFKEITADEFFNYMDTYTNIYQGFGQITSEEDKINMGYPNSFAEGHYYFYQDKALARVKFRYYSKELRKSVNETKFFQIGCAHEWEVTDRDAFEINLKCKKCGCVTSQLTGY